VQSFGNFGHGEGLTGEGYVQPQIRRLHPTLKMVSACKIAAVCLLAVCTLQAQKYSPNKIHTHAPGNAGVNPDDASDSSDEFDRPEHTLTGRPLDLDEGLSVIASALEYRHHHSLRIDCSHLVHAVYQSAGLAYPYASSAELYRGTEWFMAVTEPQPGDLIVWRGHVGIVVNPAKRAFYSALRSGLGVENYNSRYWKRRGRPHFYRYILHRELDFGEAAQAR
jgi:hypothetical protein